MTSGASAPVSADDPRMIAWTAYKATDDYANTLKWALWPHNDERKQQYVEGSLWAAFIEGFEAGVGSPTIEVIESKPGDAWAATLGGVLVGGWFEARTLAEAVAEDLRGAFRIARAGR